jgi:hypothetical protein
MQLEARSVYGGYDWRDSHSGRISTEAHTAENAVVPYFCFISRRLFENQNHD